VKITLKDGRKIIRVVSIIPIEGGTMLSYMLDGKLEPTDAIKAVALSLVMGITE
jgi:hypothetical protein